LKQSLNNGDVIEIAGAGLLIFVHVSPGLLGTLQFDVAETNSSLTQTIFAHSSDSLRFYHSSVRITYHHAVAPSEITIWAIDKSQSCHSIANLTIHSRYAKSAVIAFNDTHPRSDSDSPCYFFDFSDPVTLTIWSPSNNSAFVMVHHMEGGDIFPEPLMDVRPMSLPSSPFAIVACGSMILDFKLQIATDLSWADWSDAETEFAPCDNGDSCVQETRGVTDVYKLTVDRSIPWGIPVIAVVSGITVILFAVAILFWNLGQDFSMTTGMRPLSKMSLLPVI
jgi:hypothetical protein